MRYQAIEVTSGGKARICPSCDNEELYDGDFCMICGANLVNRCSDPPADKKASPKGKYEAARGCGAVLPGNARYCPKCGNESTFFINGWLRDWRNENPKKVIRNARIAELYEVKQSRAD